jgi:hypothetical protein
MAGSRFAENYYTSRNNALAFAAMRQPTSPEQAAQQAALEAIESKLVDANNLYIARRYYAAIDDYHDVSDLIAAQLVPNYPLGSGRWNKAKLLSGDLFDTMLSAGLEWMNVLPVRQPEVSARPRQIADPALLDDALRLAQVGVQSGLLSSSNSINAMADWQFSRAYTAQGNQAQATLFRDRAQRSNPDVVGLLEQSAQELRSAATLQSTAVSGVTLPAAFTANKRVLGAFVGNEVVQFDWKAGEAPPLEDVKQRIYATRVNTAALLNLILQPVDVTGVAINLPHYYYYVIPLGLAECMHALGRYSEAENLYFRTAAYQFLNVAVEAPYVWQRIATLYLDWGDFLFRKDNVGDARDVYERVLTIDAVLPNSPLYNTPSLKPGADVGREVIGNLNAFIAHSTDSSVAVPDLNPMIVANILQVHQQLLKIAGGLDFWGIWHPSVPIWTFDYLQSVAVNFTQLAISAERDFINFQSQADSSTLTRQQLAQSVNQASAEVDAAARAAEAAALEVSVYKDGVNLAHQRAQDAQKNASDYSGMSASQISHQAVSAQLAGGDDGDINDLNRRADTLMGIGPSAQYMREHPGNWRMEGSSATLSATEQLVSARMNQKYEVDTLNRQALEMGIAETQAKAELAAASARAAAARAGVAVAQVRAQAAVENLDAFDDQFFTPDVWMRMGDAMRRLYGRYFNMALRAAQLMQQAYNFETDQSLRWIKGDYSADEVKGLLGADMLMADIQSFTYDLITGTNGKPQPIRQTVSLAERYGFLFETQFRKTGVMEFETRIDDFDAVYPGTYAGRIQSLEIEVLGIVPPSGVSGTLTNNGISAYRTPAASIADPSASGLKYRVQSRETLVLSDFFMRQDALLAPQDSRMTKIFEGSGLASTWRLELPKAINDIDFGALTDVRLTFYYKARFDPDLHDRVLTELAARPGIHERQRAIPLRWIYPDAFFRFQDSGELRITLRKGDFRRNERDPVLTDIGVQVVTDGTLSAAGLNIALSTPGNAVPMLAATDANGAVLAGDAAWTPLIGSSAVGDYSVGLQMASNPTLAALDSFAPVVNIALILGYSFTPAA